MAGLADGPVPITVAFDLGRLRAAVDRAERDIRQRYAKLGIERRAKGACRCGGECPTCHG